MKRKILMSLLFLKVLSIQILSVNAQHPVFNLVTPPTENNNWVRANCINQDLHGFIWFGTRQGLHRYDGKNYISYYHDPEDSASISSNWVNCLFVSKTGKIWVGFYDGGLDCFDTETQTFKHYKHNPLDTLSLANNSVPALLEDKDGKLWVGTHGGLDLFNPETGTFTHYKNIPTDSSSLSNNQVRVLYQDRQGTIWVGTGSPWSNESGSDEGGLNRFNPKSETFKRYMHSPSNPNSLIDNKVRAIFEDSRGNFWIGTKGDGLHTMDRETGIITRHSYDPSHPEKLSRGPIISKNSVEGVTFIHEDITGAIWIGTHGSGISRYDPETKKINHYSNEPNNPIGLKDNYLYWAFTSKEGVLWMSAFYNMGIIYKTDPLQSSFKHYDIGTPTYEILHDTNGNIWLGTEEGLRIYESVEPLKRNFSLENKLPAQLKNDDVFAVLEKSNGVFWFITRKALWRGNPKIGEFTFFSKDPNAPNSIGSDRISHVFEDSENLIWIGTHEDGLIRLEPKSNSIAHFKSDANNPSAIGFDLISLICEDKSGNLWIGSYNGNGLSKLDKKSGLFKNYFSPVTTGIVSIQTSNITVYDMLVDHDGKLWVCTARGLFVYDEKSDDFRVHKDPNTGKQILDVCYSIHQDTKNNIWFLTPFALQKLNTNREMEASFGLEKGIDLKNLYSYFIDNNNTFFMGDSTGFSTFNLDELQPNNNPPIISFTNFRLFNKNANPGKKSLFKVPINQLNEIKLAYNQNIFSIDFAAVHYTNPEKNQCMFMLENYDNEWKVTDREFTASYYNLLPGNYRFKVKAASSEGVWSEKTMDIVIFPPWYKTVWAYIAYSLLFALMVWLIHNFQRNRVIRAERARAQQKELEQAREIEKAYTELKATQAQLIQSEKMASLGELTAGIAHEIQNPLNFVNNFSEISKELLDEMKEEIDNGDLEEVKVIANDVIQNLEKINHHGKRADSIVKGMLQHSRTSSGVKEPTDINALADEYLRLAYHGLRAKDKSFNADFKTEFDESLPKINVIPQDIGRVLLNLINNAFYAVAPPPPPAGGGIKDPNYIHKPMVTVKTSYLPPSADGGMRGAVCVSVSDNGPGIPQNIIDKIFQPFFTTKPTGSGTGLGLSLSYDIVKAHGGSITVNSKENEGTEFIIQIPAN